MGGEEKSLFYQVVPHDRREGAGFGGWGGGGLEVVMDLSPKSKKPRLFLGRPIE